MGVSVHVRVCLCMHVCGCLMCVCLAFRVMLNGMTKVATPLLASSSSLGRPIGAPRVFFNSKYLFFFFLFFPPNFCALLALNTGHLRVPDIHEDTWRYLNL